MQQFFYFFECNFCGRCHAGGGGWLQTLALVSELKGSQVSSGLSGHGSETNCLTVSPSALLVCLSCKMQIKPTTTAYHFSNVTHIFRGKNMYW